MNEALNVLGMTEEKAISILERLIAEDEDIDFYSLDEKMSFEMAISALKDIPKRKWIPVTKRLPEEPYACWVTVWDTNVLTQEEFENVLPYPIGYDGETWNDGDGNICPFEVIAWQPLPEPYKAESEDKE